MDAGFYLPYIWLALFALFSLIFAFRGRIFAGAGMLAAAAALSVFLAGAGIPWDAAAFITVYITYIIIEFIKGKKHEQKGCRDNGKRQRHGNDAEMHQNT